MYFGILMLVEMDSRFRRKGGQPGRDATQVGLLASTYIHMQLHTHMNTCT